MVKEGSGWREGGREGGRHGEGGPCGINDLDLGGRIQEVQEIGGHK